MQFPSERRLQRGIYRSPFLSKNGHCELVAVDDEGRRVAGALVFSRDDEKAVGRMLMRFLTTGEAA